MDRKYFLFTLLALVAGGAFAQSFPSKPIKIIVPFGGAWWAYFAADEQWHGGVQGQQFHHFGRDGIEYVGHSARGG